jgi:hypothetical protein
VIIDRGDLGRLAAGAGKRRDFADPGSLERRDQCRVRSGRTYRIHAVPHRLRRDPIEDARREQHLLVRTTMYDGCALENLLAQPCQRGRLALGQYRRFIGPTLPERSWVRLGEDSGPEPPGARQHGPSLGVQPESRHEHRGVQRRAPERAFVRLPADADTIEDGIQAAGGVHARGIGRVELQRKANLRRCQLRDGAEEIREASIATRQQCAEKCCRLIRSSPDERLPH